MDKDELRRRREALGMTQSELAKELDFNLRTVQFWEKGKIRIRRAIVLALERLEQKRPRNP